MDAEATRVLRAPVQGRRPGRAPRHRRSSRRRLLVAAALVVVVLVAVVGSRRGGPLVPAASCTVTAPGSGGGVKHWTLQPSQAQEASVIAAVAGARSLPDHAVTVALATALQESKLADLPSGDLDSVGLFQQRPSQGWGPKASLLDPVYASGAFYDHLVQVPGWADLPVTEAAQAVQRSAAPSAYAVWEEEARALARALTGETPHALGCDLRASNAGAPDTASLSAAAGREWGRAVLGVPLAGAQGWAVAAWAVAHGAVDHLRAVTYGGWTWRAGAPSWVPVQAAGTGVVAS